MIYRIKCGSFSTCVLGKSNMRPEVRRSVFQSHLNVTLGKLLFLFSLIISEVELIVMPLS